MAHRNNSNLCDFFVHIFPQFVCCSNNRKIVQLFSLDIFSFQLWFFGLFGQKAYQAIVCFFCMIIIFLFFLLSSFCKLHENSCFLCIFLNTLCRNFPSIFICSFAIELELNFSVVTYLTRKDNSLLLFSLFSTVFLLSRRRQKELLYT